MTLQQTRWITGTLAVFDYFLSFVALFVPDFYMQVMHGSGANENIFMLRRTGVLWFAYAVVQTVAFINPQRFHLSVLIVAAFRLVEVPADPVYLLTSSRVSPLGAFGLIFAPIFNLTVGILLIRAWLNRDNTVKTLP